jgi:hypothetical protein
VRCVLCSDYVPELGTWVNGGFWIAHEPHAGEEGFGVVQRHQKRGIVRSVEFTRVGATFFLWWPDVEKRWPGIRPVGVPSLWRTLKTTSPGQAAPLRTPENEEPMVAASGKPEAVHDKTSAVPRVPRRGRGQKYTPSQLAELQQEYRDQRRLKPASKIEDIDAHLSAYSKDRFGKTAHADTLRDKVRKPVDLEKLEK